MPVTHIYGILDTLQCGPFGCLVKENDICVYFLCLGLGNTFSPHSMLYSCVLCTVLMFNQYQILSLLLSGYGMKQITIQTDLSHQSRVCICAQSQNWNVVSITERDPVVFRCQAHAGKWMNRMMARLPVK